MISPKPIEQQLVLDSNMRICETKRKQLDNDALDGASEHGLGDDGKQGVTTKTTMEDKNWTRQET